MLDQDDPLAVFRSLPCYKPIVKSLLQKQIQSMLDQMSDEAGEESMILTVSLQHDSSQSDQTGKEKFERGNKRKHLDTNNHASTKQPLPKRKKKPLFISSIAKPTETRAQKSSVKASNESSHNFVLWENDDNRSSSFVARGSNGSHNESESDNNDTHAYENEQPSTHVSNNPSCGFNLGEPHNSCDDKVLHKEIIGTSTEDMYLSIDIKPDLDCSGRIKEHEQTDKNAGVNIAFSQTDMKEEPLDYDDRTFDSNEDQVSSSTKVLLHYSKTTGGSDVDNCAKTKQKSVPQNEFSRAKSVNKTGTTKSNKSKTTPSQKVKEHLSPKRVSKVTRASCKSIQFDNVKVVEHPKESKLQEILEVDKESCVLVKAISGTSNKTEPLSGDIKADMQADVSEFDLNTGEHSNTATDGIIEQQSNICDADFNTDTLLNKIVDDIIGKHNDISGKDPNLTNDRATEQQNQISGKNFGDDDTCEDPNRVDDRTFEQQNETSGGDLNTRENQTTTNKVVGLTNDFGEGPLKSGTGVLSETRTGRGKLHSKKEPFVCGRCGQILKTRSGYSSHRRHHEGVAAYKCCGKQFYSRTNLKRHRFSVHKEENRYKCNECNRAFAVNADLSAPQRSVHQDRRFICDTCGLKYTTRIKLMDHMDSHSGERRYFSVCGKSFRYSSGLSKHSRSCKNNRNK